MVLLQLPFVTKGSREGKLPKLGRRAAAKGKLGD
jgi:hypothetical protein